MNLSALSKADRKRVLRRAAVPEDGLNTKSGLATGQLRGEILIVLFAGAVAGSLGYGVFTLVGRISGLWLPGGLFTAIVFLALGLALAGYGVFGRRIKGRKARADKKADVASGVIDEITFPVSAAKAFRDPEHGSLMYFLHLDDGRVFFDMFDNELGGQGWEKSVAVIPKDKLPGSMLHLIFGSVTGELLGSRFSGPRFKPVSINVIKGAPDYWPSPGTFRSTNWDDIEGIFAARNT